MHSRVSSLQVTRRGFASFPLFSRIASCRKLRLRTGTARLLLLFLALMVISTCAGLHPKSRTTYAGTRPWHPRSEEHTSELQSHLNLVCRLLLEKKKTACSTPRTRCSAAT